MKKTGIIITTAAICLLLAACNNFLHDLVPPNEDKILSFSVPGQIEREVYTGNVITVKVDKDTDIRSLRPVIKVSPKANVIPVTFSYIQAAFPSVNFAVEAIALHQTNDLTSYVADLVEQNKDDFSIPAINMPIDFTNPVNFIVIAAAGNTRQYTVIVEIETDEAQLLNFSFAKYDNAQLVTDAVAVINKATKVVDVKAVYPAEMNSLDFALVPSFEIDGESMEAGGGEVISGLTPIQFNSMMGSQTITLTVIKAEVRTEYTLNIFFTEDPDTIRSITDFRFTRADNSGLAADAVASITNTGNTGIITVQVLYSGVKPASLVPRFVSPGTVTVLSATQTSGSSSHDFSSPIEYRVLSRNGQFVRIYTVNVEFINITNDAPRILSFSFPYGSNRGLIQDADGDINDASERITVEVRYSGFFAPDVLIPEFSAQGLVTVFGSVQISGASEQDFSRQVKYTVTSPVNPLLKRDYIVQCLFVRDDSSDAAITAFGFYPENNLGLLEILSARVDQGTEKITLFAPIGSGVTTRIMVPQFSASGYVTVEGLPQRSGVTGRMFDEPVVYRVTSTNGQRFRDYIVEVKELGTTIYVNQNAAGLNDGTSWENAFISLKTACEAAAQFNRDIPKEIWIARGTYRPENTDDYYTVAPNTYYIGGFAGNETGKSLRNIAANPVIIGGNPAKMANNNVHAVFFNRELLLSGENVYFEDIEFRNFMHNERAVSNFTYNPISLRWGTNAEGTVSLKGCRFIDVNGPCIETSNGNVRLQDVYGERIAAMYNNNKSTIGFNLVTNDFMDNVQIVNQIQYGNSGYAQLFLFYGGERPASTLTLSNIDMEDCVTGFMIFGNNAVISVSDFSANEINTVDIPAWGLGSIFDIRDGARVGFTNVDINNVVNGRSFAGTIFMNEVRGNITMDNISISNVAVPFANSVGGAGGICINTWGNFLILGDMILQTGTPEFIHRGGRVEMNNITLHNIQRRTIPILNIYKPDVDVFFDNFNITSGINANINLFRNFYAEDIKIVSPSTSSHTVNITGNGAAGEVKIKNMETGNGTFSCSGNLKDITVNNVKSPAWDSNFSISGTNAAITVDDISVRDLSVSNHKTLSLTNADVSRSFTVSSTSYNGNTGIANHESTVIDKVIMLNTDAYSRYSMSFTGGSTYIKDSIFLLNNIEGNNTSNIHLITLGSYNSLGTTNTNVIPSTYAEFNNCRFEDVSSYRYIATNGIGQHYYIFGLHTNVDLKMINNCRFNFNTSLNRGVLTAHYYSAIVQNARFEFDGVSFNNFNTSAGAVMYLRGNNLYRVRHNSSINGTLFSVGAAQTALNAATLRYDGAVLTFN